MPEVATERRIAMRRVFAAPRELVWRAFTEPDRLACWWGKRGWSTPVDSITMDVRPGGAFRLLSVNDEDGRAMALDAVYREVRAPDRLVWADGDRLATVTLTVLAERATRVDLVTTIVGTAALRRHAMAGMSSAWDRLADHLTDHHPQRSPR